MIATVGEVTFAVRNPATGHEIDRVPDLDLDSVTRLVESAHAASKAWAGRPADERAEILQAAARLLLARSREFGCVITAENGKPLLVGVYRPLSTVPSRGSAAAGLAACSCVVAPW
jgi:succinate-semialdehyde dehydrogenase/glutarate-semialdehyde dehydrogenase